VAFTVRHCCSQRTSGTWMSAIEEHAMAMDQMQWQC
jgi:hypothetical protein